ncbi:DUF5522 domain-containing protein [Ekhidna sp.]|uniref:DUF5522 domain-containing protein n=1 Tax=Ekhidna sp. TaxID=2608089 RepID=UPI003CCC21D4
MFVFQLYKFFTIHCLIFYHSFAVYYWFYKINDLTAEAQFKVELDPKDYYINKNGLMVFTEQYHRKRGYCCGNACLHCPYNHENVGQ